MVRTFEVRRVLVGQGFEIRAAIAFEDTAERDALKAGGYRWDASRKVWTLPMSAQAVQALLDRGYLVNIDNIDTRSLMVRVLERNGFAVEALPLRYLRRGDDNEYHPIELTERHMEVLLAEVAQDKAEAAARLAAKGN